MTNSLWRGRVYRVGLDMQIARKSATKEDMAFNYVQGDDET